MENSAMEHPATEHPATENSATEYCPVQHQGWTIQPHEPHYHHLQAARALEGGAARQWWR
jgi:hypothetical protein